MAEKDAPVRSWLMERRYFSLIIVLAFVILSAVTFSLCYRHHAIYTEQTLKEDRAAASLLSLVLDEHLKKLVSVMESYTQRPLLLQAVRDKNAEKARMQTGHTLGCLSGASGVGRGKLCLSGLVQGGQ
jgi:hypothetical protein